MIAFAHSYDGYARHDDPAAVVRAVRERWDATGRPGDDLDELRGTLFFEVRAHRHGGGHDRFSERPLVVALVTRIRELSGGRVPVVRSRP